MRWLVTLLSLGLNLAAPARAESWECLQDADCVSGRCLFRSGVGGGRCADSAMTPESAETLRQSNGKPLIERKSGDLCNYSVDCLPGFSCFLGGPAAPIGRCLRDPVEE